MDYSFEYDCKNIDWSRVQEILKTVGMFYYSEEEHQRAFENSYARVFVFSEGKLVGFCRAISDGVHQAAIYDVALDPEYQGMHIGTQMLEKLMEKLENCNVILYSNIGKEEFYHKQGFSKMRTGMARFINRERMLDRGFIEE